MNKDKEVITMSEDKEDIDGTGNLDASFISNHGWSMHIEGGTTLQDDSTIAMIQMMIIENAKNVDAEVAKIPRPFIRTSEPTPCEAAGFYTRAQLLEALGEGESKQ